MKYIWWMYHNPSSFLLMDVCSASNFFHMQKRAALKVFCLPPRILHLWQYLYSIYAEEELICGTLCSSSNIPEPAMKVKVLVTQSCLTLCDPMDCSPSGSSVHGILQARILEGIAISFSRVSSWPRDRTRISLTVDRRFTVWATREVPVECITESNFLALWLLLINLKLRYLHIAWVKRAVLHCKKFQDYCFS